MNLYLKTKDLPVFKQINAFLDSKVYIILVALLTFLCSSFSLELFTYLFVAIVVFYVSIFGRDYLCTIPFMMYMYSSPSIFNNPGYTSDSIFYPEKGLYYIIGIFGLIIIGIIIRIITREGLEFFKKKRSLSLGFLLLGFSMFIGGLENSEDFIHNTLYWALLILSFVAFYYLITGLVEETDHAKEYMAYTGLWLGIMLCFELLFTYIANSVIMDGTIDRSYIYTGWGICNNIGVLMAISIPFAFYFAINKKNTFWYLLLSDIILLGIVFTTSRGNLVGAIVTYGLCFLYSIYKKLKIKQNLINVGLMIVILIFAFTIFKDKTITLFNTYFSRGFDSSNRFEIWKTGLERFSENIVFGEGFFKCEAYKFGGADLATFMPSRYHNTIVQFLASFGLFGFLCYGFHRFQTIKLYLDNKNDFRTLIFISIIGLLVASLLDCHMVNIGPNLVYSCLLAFMEMDKNIIKEKA